MSISRRGRPQVDEENPYWMSFSDIMSALLIIFILASVVLIVQVMEIREQLEEQQQEFTEEIQMLRQAEEVRRTILHEAEEELQRRGIRVSVSENDTVLSIPNDILGFDTAEFDLGSQYQDTATQIGKVLAGVILQDDRVDYLDTVFIEGHTDNRSFQGMMGKGNWGLSAFRAISLWQHWLDVLPEDRRLDRLVNQDGQPVFSVSGYAESRPVTKVQETEEELRANRRIDIRFTIRRPTVEDYREVQDAFVGDSQ
ncbi:chemotaxis protein MotB [Halomonas litopenaei]|uniref:Chemotaxis protein MotB n=1 Tax=Halomonas litopenaei TaxID=2109328 RepID=A0ABX5IRD4_9GAMM|nr:MULTISPECIES: OmpA family protein [Halomonas]PTL89070.1 chemotaxis protein MotB [Halomonas litopenaei]PTL89346.1 chemotaxis protein MotB [Halomonas sp. SYSU XM8]